jgi:hypothetical protein
LIDHPFLSFKELSDDELLDKTSEIHKRLNKAFMWGSSSDLISQLQWMLEMIEEEKMERMKKQNFDLMQGMFPEVVESDPEFSKSKVEPEESQARVVKPANSKKAQNLPVPSFHKEYVGPDKSGK